MTLRGQTKQNFTAQTADAREQLMLAIERTSAWRNNILEILRTIHKPFGAGEWQALAHLFQRTYWKRVWIIQELTLARKVTLHCGPSQCEYSTFMPVIQLMMLADQRTLWAYFGPEDLDGLKQHMRTVAEGMQPTMVTAGGASSVLHHNFPKLLHMTALVDATDPRDKVYALLSLVPPERTVIRIDYTKSTAQVYTDLGSLRDPGHRQPGYTLHVKGDKEQKDDQRPPLLGSRSQLDDIRPVLRRPAATWGLPCRR
jgi:hypothetical protein